MLEHSPARSQGSFQAPQKSRLFRTTLPVRTALRVRFASSYFFSLAAEERWTAVCLSSLFAVLLSAAPCWSAAKGTKRGCAAHKRLVYPVDPTCCSDSLGYSMSCDLRTAGWGIRRGKPLAMLGSRAGRSLQHRLTLTVISLHLLLAASSYGGGTATATAATACVAGRERGNYMSSSGTSGKRITGYAGWWRGLKRQLARSSEGGTGTTKPIRSQIATEESGRRSRVGPTSPAVRTAGGVRAMDTDIQGNLCECTNRDV